MSPNVRALAKFLLAVYLGAERLTASKNFGERVNLQKALFSG